MHHKKERRETVLPDLFCCKLKISSAACRNNPLRKTTVMQQRVERWSVCETVCTVWLRGEVCVWKVCNTFGLKLSVAVSVWGSYQLQWKEMHARSRDFGLRNHESLSIMAECREIPSMKGHVMQLNKTKYNLRAYLIEHLRFKCQNTSDIAIHSQVSQLRVQRILRRSILWSIQLSVQS